LDALEPHIIGLDSLAMHHRDPFDRLLVAQAMAESLTLVTHDAVVAGYDPAIVLV
jgi:PIN domain nuclease of toxin-antitoxin system